MPILNQSDVTKTRTNPSAGMLAILHGVYVLPNMFTPAECGKLIALKGQAHHDPDGGHADNKKPLLIPWAARQIEPYVSKLSFADYRVHGVDPYMRLYKLVKGKGAVSQHKDRDYAGPYPSRALYSILVYLNNDYEGGETVFDGCAPAPHVEVGGGLLFKHDLLHEGLAVRSGTKHVLKTDLFVVLP